MNQALLKKLGLSPHETRAYAAIIKEPEISPATLAKRLGIKRTSAYNIAHALAEKGLIVEDVSRRPRTLAPASPADIARTFSAEKQRLIERENAAHELAEFLAQQRAATTYPTPRIRFVEEEKMGSFLKQETPKWHRALGNLEKPIWWGFQDHTFPIHFAPWIDSYWKTALPTEITRLLTNESAIERKLEGKYPRRNIAFLPNSANFASSIWIAEEYVIVLNTRHKPFYLYEIHDTLLANDLREVFQLLWNFVNNKRVERKGT